MEVLAVFYFRMEEENGGEKISGSDYFDGGGLRAVVHGCGEKSGAAGLHQRERMHGV